MVNPNRGIFGYEGEGFEVSGAELTHSAERGWNIGSERSDERIREDVCERLMTDHEVADARGIEVAVANGIVTLTGTVAAHHARRAAVDVCELVQGVRDVRDELRVAD
ncbi:MAG: BON domain-containing protein [Acidobacteriota bacterium]|nr:BON domain-containing protein [Acidobacteriota bacterium]